MTNVRLTLGCGDYDLTRGLIDGSVRPPGIELTVLPMPSPERHWRMMRFEEFDVAELSMSHYLCAYAKQRELQGDPGLSPSALSPLLRLLRTDAGIEEPQDLNGKRIALRTFQNTAGVWTRGHPGRRLRRRPGQRSSWFTQDEEETPWDAASWLHIERVPAGPNMDADGLAGDLDAAIYPETLPSFAKGDPRVKRLFADPKEVERSTSSARASSR